MTLNARDHAPRATSARLDSFCSFEDCLWRLVLVSLHHTGSSSSRDMGEWNTGPGGRDLGRAEEDRTIGKLLTKSSYQTSGNTPAV